MTRRRRWRRRSAGWERDGRSTVPSRALVLALVLACLTLITLDHRGGSDSPLEPARRAVGEVFGPVEGIAAAVVRPFTSVPGILHTQRSLADQVQRLEQENDALRAQLATSGLDRNRLAQYDGLTSAAQRMGQSLVPARVIGFGPSQAFSRTVTIDAGSEAGVQPDLTVVNSDGLVGRVIRVTRTTATVLLIIDAESTVGGRIGSSLEMGFLRGRGDLAEQGLDLELVDDAVMPAAGDPVLTWGSDGGAPYAADIPIGRVTSVITSVRDTTRRAVVQPYVDFTALDVVGVVVPAGTTSDRAVVRADGTSQ